MKSRKHLYVIAGANGTGKTTFAQRFLPAYAHCPEFINADLLAKGLAPFAPETAALQAGKMLLRKIEELIESGENFAFETTLSGKAYAGLFRRLRKQGYQIHLIFLMLPSVELAVERVKQRESMGGHGIPEDVVRRRYEAGFRNLSDIYAELTDTLAIFENSGSIPIRLYWRVKPIGVHGEREILRRIRRDFCQ